jgi:uncharacterized protein involved in type VI secretion and phage assembly
MAEGLLDSVSPADRPDDRRIYGVVNAEVITNCDQTHMGRVKVRFPWLPGYEPWARVATLMAGLGRGMFFIPQKGEEVLVAFNHGYVNEPYIVGSLWNGHDTPKEETAKDPIHQRAIRTPEGHEIAFDDAAHTIAIKSAKGQSVVLGPDKIEIALNEQKTTMITLSKGNLTIKAENTITLDASAIDIVGGNTISIHTRPSAKLGKRIEIYGSDDCSIDSTEIHIG